MDKVLLQEALTGGEWVTDNAQLAAHLTQRQAKGTEARADPIKTASAGGVVIPVVSFTNDLLDLQVLF